MTKSSERPRRSMILIMLGSVLGILLSAGPAKAQGLDVHQTAFSGEESSSTFAIDPASIEAHRSSTSNSIESKRPLLVAATETLPKAIAPLLEIDDAESTPMPDETTLSKLIPHHFDSGNRTESDPASGFEPLPRKSRFLEEEQSGVDPDAAQNGHTEKFHWRPAVLQSIMIQGVQHAYAIAVQERMRRELKGPWFKDWFTSVSHLHGWDDGNRFFTNYVAHPMQGGMTGFIFLQNHDRLKTQKFAESKTYWADRLKAMLWSAAWSVQWEIGPFSQASIGNVGKKKGMAYVDLVMTPTAGTGWMVFEEALDRYVVRHLEGKTNFVLKIFLRTVLNPMRGVANTLRFKPPWYRDRPFGS